MLDTEEPLASVALAVQEIESLGETTLELSCQVEPVLVEPFEEDQEYETPKAPSLTSVALAEQVNKLDVVNPLDGDTTAVVIDGTVFITVTTLESCAALEVVPSEAVTLQRKVAPTLNPETV